MARRRIHNPEPTNPHTKENNGPFARELVLQPFLAGLTHFDALAPL